MDYFSDNIYVSKTYNLLLHIVTCFLLHFNGLAASRTIIIIIFCYDLLKLWEKCYFPKSCSVPTFSLTFSRRHSPPLYQSSHNTILTVTSPCHTSFPPRAHSNDTRERGQPPGPWQLPLETSLRDSWRNYLSFMSIVPKHEREFFFLTEISCFHYSTHRPSCLSICTGWWVPTSLGNLRIPPTLWVISSISAEVMYVYDKSFHYTSSFSLSHPLLFYASSEDPW